MRISDWSSDVCSSDLGGDPRLGLVERRAGQHQGEFVPMQPGDEIRGPRRRPQVLRDMTERGVAGGKAVAETGRASGRERGGRFVWGTEVDVSGQKISHYAVHNLTQSYLCSTFS